MNIHGGYFWITNPLHIIDRWLNPFRHSSITELNGKNIKISWTQRADDAFSLRDNKLIIEMQLYFSCVVKKRLIFHDNDDLDYVTINNKLGVVFRPVEASSCSPEEFASNYPVKQQLTSNSAVKMHPSSLEIDFKNSDWQGTFTI